MFATFNNVPLIEHQIHRIFTHRTMTNVFNRSRNPSPAVAGGYFLECPHGEFAAQKNSSLLLSRPNLDAVNDHTADFVQNYAQGLRTPYHTSVSSITTGAATYPLLVTEYVTRLTG